MVKQIFVNLPVKDLKKSMDFFSSLGFTYNPHFTDENAASMIVSENISVMLITERFFQTFTKKEISDAKKYTEVLLALSLESNKEVDEMMKKALQEGAKKAREIQDLGFMYSGAFEDLDGHIWEPFYMDPNYLHKP